MLHSFATPHEKWTQRFSSYFFKPLLDWSCFRNNLGTFCDSNVLLDVEPVSLKGWEVLWTQRPPHDVKGFAGEHCTSMTTNAYIPWQRKNQCNKNSYQKHNHYCPRGAKFISRRNQSKNQCHILNALEGPQQSCPSRKELWLSALSMKKQMIAAKQI